MAHRIRSGLLILAAALGLSGCASVGPTALDDTRVQTVVSLKVEWSTFAPDQVVVD